MRIFCSKVILAVFSSYMYVEKAAKMTYVWKMRAQKVDEIDTWNCLKDFAEKQNFIQTEDRYILDNTLKNASTIRKVFVLRWPLCFCSCFCFCARTASHDLKVMSSNRISFKVQNGCYFETILPSLLDLEE